MEFKGEYRFLSNMYQYPQIRYGKGVYSCVESAFQAAKCASDKERKLFESLNGFQAKARGQTVVMVPNWEKIKVNIMKSLVEQKFDNWKLRQKLREVKGDIYEDNGWKDDFWGRYHGTGANHLGKILMEIRDSIEASVIKI